jgi:hypothetical protein
MNAFFAGFTAPFIFLHKDILRNFLYSNELVTPPPHACNSLPDNKLRNNRAFTADQPQVCRTANGAGQGLSYIFVQHKKIPEFKP